MKYIIKNCPNYDECGCRCITDCLLKKIVKICDSSVSKVLYKGESLKFIEGSKLASDILKLLDIEECEDE